MEQALRRLLGIDMKMKQYAEGSTFVTAVVEEVGMATFNKVWTSPETLPTRAEITDPQLWLARVVNGSAPTVSDASAGFGAPASSDPAGSDSAGGTGWPGGSGSDGTDSPAAGAE